MAKKVNRDVSIVKAITARSTDKHIVEALSKDNKQVSAKGSSNLHSFSYDSDERTLKITFIKGGREYEYYGVPKNVYDGLVLAPSRGKYFHQFIRYKYKQAEV